MGLRLRSLGVEAEIACSKERPVPRVGNFRLVDEVVAAGNAHGGQVVSPR